MAVSTVTKHFTDGTLVLSDGTGVAVTFSMPLTVGDVTIDGVGQKMREPVVYQTRGVAHSIRHAARAFATVSLTAHIADYSDGTDATAIDFFLKSGSFASNASVFGANAEVYGLDLILTIEGTDHGDAADHVISMLNFVGTIGIAEGEPNTLSVSGTLYDMGDGTLTNSLTIT